MLGCSGKRMHRGTIRTSSLLLLLLLYNLHLSHSQTAVSTAEPEANAFVANEPEGTNGEPEGESESESESESKSEGYAEGEPEQEGEPEGNPQVEGEDPGSEPEAEGSNMVQVCVFVSIYGILIVIILVGNILVALTILRDKTIRATTSNLYLLSLVSARASIAVFVIPARITGMFSEKYLGSILCKLCHFAALGSSAASIFSVAAIGISKYIQVTHEKSDPMSMKKSAGIIGIIWLLGFAYAIRAAITNNLVIVDTPQGQIWSCTTDQAYAELNKYFIFVDILCLFFIPLVVILVCYTQVIKTLAKIGKPSANHAPARMDLVPKYDKQSMKAIKMLVILMVLFAVCTSAPMILRMYILWGGVYFDSYPIVETIIYMFSYSNSWFNLIVFAIFRDDLRKGFRELVRCKKQGGKIVPVDTTYDPGKEAADRDQALRMMEF